MSITAKQGKPGQVGLIPERLARKASRADYYFRPDPWVEQLVARVETLLAETIDSGSPVMDEIGRHMLFGYAKRLRPIFVLLAQHMFTEDTLDRTIKSAAVAELIHCASLFHDDVIDQASTRKGKTSANSVWGNRSAVIVGDHFVVLAYKMISELRDFRILELYNEMCRALAHGILLEISYTGDLDLSEEQHFDIIGGKTAVFFETAAVTGGYIGGATDEQEKELAGFGINFGLAFQLSDDLLDLFSDPDATGKPRGMDLRSGIYTMPVIQAIKTDPGFVSKYRLDDDSTKISTDTVGEIAHYMRSNGIFDFSKKQVDLHIEKSLHHLEKLPESHARDMFKDLLDRIANREYS